MPPERKYISLRELSSLIRETTNGYAVDLFGSRAIRSDPILLLITDLIDTNRSRGAEVGLPPRFAGRIIVHCPPRCVPPCYWDVHCYRGRCCRDPRGLRPGGRAVGCYRIAPAVPGDHRQREGAGTRSEHRGMDAAASPAAPGDAAASPQGQLARLLDRREPLERESGR
jgi:hypothetical protein